MINKFFLEILNILIYLIDLKNKKKIYSFLKKKFGSNFIEVIDIGAHRGETIDFFIDDFNIKKIRSFEPNKELFYKLKNKKKFNQKNIEIFNYGVGFKDEIIKLKILIDTASSTFNNLNYESKYFLKKKILSFFSRKKNFITKEQLIEVMSLSNFIDRELIRKIDVLKIDTEGFEYNILSGLKKSDFDKIGLIYFEHHFDNMIKKNTNFQTLTLF